MALTPADYYDLSRPVDVAVSPDGERVVITVREADAVDDSSHSSLFVVPTDGSKEPHRLTRASDAHSPQWSPDGGRLAFLATRAEDLDRTLETPPETEEEDKDDDPDQQVWLFDFDRGGDAVQVTDREDGVREFDWGPDGEQIVIAARDPTEEEETELEDRKEGGPIEIDRLQHKADGTGWLDSVTTYLFIVDVTTGETTRLDDAYGQGAREAHTGLQPAWGPTDRIAFASNRTERPDDSGVMDLYTISPDGSDLRKLTDSTLRTSGYRWSPDGEALAYRSSDPENWYEPTELRVVEPAGEPTHRSVTDPLDRTLSFYGAPTWLGADELLAAIGDEGLTRLIRAEGSQPPERTLPAQGRDRSLKALAVGGDTVAVVLSDPAAGPDVYTLSVDALDRSDAAALTQVTSFNDALLSDFDGETRRITYPTDDGTDIEAIVHLPPTFDPDRRYPVIASIHGGPMSYDAPEFGFLYAYWASQGYVVYRPNYRGSTSYGQAFAERLRGIRGSLERADVLAGLDALTERGWVDPEQSLVTGFSYGGITTANVITHSDAFAAAAAEHGIYDFRSAFGTDDNHLWHEWEFGLPWENAETYTEISSITDVDNVETPVLLTAGEQDWRCPPTQAEQFYVQVKKRGVDAKLVVYQEENHNVGDPDRAVHRIETLTEWFETHALDD